MDPASFARAREVEMQFFRSMRVYDKVLRAQAMKAGKKAVGTRGIDVNKGDLVNPGIRSRLVAQDFKVKYDGREDLFAATLPLEALKLVISDSATFCLSGNQKCVVTAGVTHAYFNAPGEADIHVNIPPEDLDDAETACDLVGKLHVSLSRTTEAAASWQGSVVNHMASLEFTRSLLRPTVHWDAHVDVKVPVHAHDHVRS